MKIIPNIELPTLAPGRARVGSSDQIDQNTQSFNHSLLTFLNLSSKSGTSKEDAPKTLRQRESTLEEAKPLPEVPARLAQQLLILPQQAALPHQDLPAQQGQLSFPSVTPMTPTLGALVASSDDPPVPADFPMLDGTAMRVIGNESVVAHSGVFPLVGVQSSSGEFGNSVRSGLPILSGANKRDDVLTDPQSTSETFDSHTVVNSASNGFAIPTQIAAMSAGPDRLRSSLPNSDLTAVTSAPVNSVQSAVPMATIHATQGPLSSKVLDTSTAGSQDVLPKVFQDAFLGIVRNAYSDAGSIAIQSADANPTSVGGKDALSQAMPNTHLSTIPFASPSADPDASLGASRNKLSNAGQTSITTVVAKELDANPEPALGAPAVSMDGGVAPKASPITPDHGIVPSASPEQSIFAFGLGVPGVASDLLVATNQLGGGALKLGRAGLSNLIPASLTKPADKSVVNGKEESKGSTNSADLKQHPLSASAKSNFQSDLQEATQTSDQSRGYTPSQGKSVASDQTNFTDHAVVAVAHTQTTIIASAVQSTTTAVGSFDQKVMAADTLAYASTGVPQSLPVINTAKLIQSIGQSEMRVGMRSNEFGNISISTSATRGLISAQISLDHSELARTLAAHLPEMQARLGGNEAVDVRIETNGIGAGQGAGMHGSMSNGSADHSRDGRQQPESTSSSYFGSGFVARQVSPIAAAATTSDGRLSARLDVRF